MEAPLEEVDDEFDLPLDADFFESLDETSWQLLETGSQRTETEASTTDVSKDDLKVPESVMSGTVGFQKANGQQLPRPSAAAMALAAKRLKLDDADEFHVSDKENVDSGHGTTDRHAHTGQGLVGPSIPTMIPQHGLFLPKQPVGHPTPPHTPIPRKRTSMSPLRTSQLANLAKSGVSNSPSPLRKQISLGITPRTYRTGLPAPKARGSFTPPFKKGAPSPSVPASHASITSPPKAPSLFNLSIPPVRTGYREAGLLPHVWKSEAEAREHGVPAEVCLILQDPTRASHYAFVSWDKPPRGATDAYTELLQLGAHKVPLKWVQNHWQLILWKLAAYVASDPRRVQVYWHWDRVLCDLRYRYEREVHKKERSVIKRLQEEPQQFTKPMVLCVHQILRFDDTSEEGASLVLQLTDGWYKVRAELDAPLRRAVERRKIRLGHKLAIACAKVRIYDLRSTAVSERGHMCWTPCIRPIYCYPPMRHGWRHGMRSWVSNRMRLYPVSVVSSRRAASWLGLTFWPIVYTLWATWRASSTPRVRLSSVVPSTERTKSKSVSRPGRRGSTVRGLIWPR